MRIIFDMCGDHAAEVKLIFGENAKLGVTAENLYCSEWACMKSADTLVILTTPELRMTGTRKP